MTTERVLCSRRSCYKVNPDYPRFRTCSSCREKEKERRERIRAKAEADGGLCTRCGQQKEAGSRFKLCKRCRDQPRKRKKRKGWVGKERRRARDEVLDVAHPYEVLPPAGMECQPGHALGWYELV